MKLSKPIKILLFVIINITNIFSGLPPQTMVFMGKGTYKRAKDLRVNDYIPVYDIPNDRLDSHKRKITEISTRTTKDLILIETEADGVVAVGTYQKLFNCKTKKFICAEEFEIGDELFSPEKGVLVVTDIKNEELDKNIGLYDVTLESGQIFLILTDQKTHILAHNMAAAAQIGGSFGVRLAVGGIGAIATITSRYLTSSASPGGMDPRDPKDNDRTKEFEKKISKMSPNERVAAIKTESRDVAIEKGLIRDRRLSEINNRDVYRDMSTDTLYSVDTQHGRFEVLNGKGIHLGEVDFDFNFTKGPDLSGKHNLKK